MKISNILKIFIFIFIAAILAGTYLVLTRKPVIRIAETVRVTIPEGYNVRQIAAALEDAGLFSSEDFLAKAEIEEGFLFPDTYEFYKETTPTNVINKMKENFSDKVLSRIEKVLREKDKKLSEIIIMSSILEKEAALEKDWKIISGILWKRIDAKMPLQVDASLTYVTGKPSSDLTDGDLAMDSPYNTYKNLGLPASAISNPGLGAIEAALNPEKTSYWFYLSDKEGEIHYAKTFEEHKLNKNKYLR
ncbi:endolytic transglycosylase MltG [Candidatus Giovannonibacteria bacterium]|nr:endolytic transglycosylase MltG [Candidatus Giovannonibacteria bacterium]